MRILGISGSLRAASVNSALLEAARRLAPAGVELIVYRDLAGLPPFNPDDEVELPPPAAALRALVAACDGLIIASPEYAHGMPGALKNALDWLVGGAEFPGKPVMLINAAPRAFHAQSALREILGTMSGQLIAEAFVTVKAPANAPSVEEIIADPALAAPLRAGVEKFAAVLRAQGGRS